MRSAMVSRSSCEKTDAMYIMARPMGVDVSNWLPDGDKRHVQLRQPLDEGGEVSDAAADPVEPVDDEHTEAPGLGRAHHPPEGGAVQVPAGEAVIFKNFRLRARPARARGDTGGIARSGCQRFHPCR